ncbi:MAG: KaiC domain-containing protein [Thermoprotei archaeon]|nr:MAG: KaiC domain-containing protein [Thermoprotei archaeon]
MVGGVPDIVEEEEVEKKPRKKVKKATRQRLSTGIEKLDQYLEGGIPQGTWLFIAGEPGTGKTILCLHIAYASLKDGIDVIYVTTEQPFKDLLEQAKQFSINLSPYVKESLHVIDIFDLYEHAWEAKKNGKLKIADPLDPDNLANYLRELCQQEGLENPLIIIDSLSAFWVDKPAMARRITYRLKLRLARLRPTVIGTLQYAVTTGSSFGFGAEHIADGIIQLYFEPWEKAREIQRWGIIRKMRLTNHYKKAFKYDIVKGKGFVIM